MGRLQRDVSVSPQRPSQPRSRVLATPVGGRQRRRRRRVGRRRCEVRVGITQMVYNIWSVGIVSHWKTAGAKRRFTAYLTFCQGTQRRNYSTIILVSAIRMDSSEVGVRRSAVQDTVIIGVLSGPSRGTMGSGESRARSEGRHRTNVCARDSMSHWVARVSDETLGVRGPQRRTSMSCCPDRTEYSRRDRSGETQRHGGHAQRQDRRQWAAWSTLKGYDGPPSG